MKGRRRLALAECTCGQPIRFVRVDLDGTVLPINPGGNSRGTVVAYRVQDHLEGWVISKDRPAPPQARRYTSHAETCTAVERSKTVPREPTPTLF